MRHIVSHSGLFVYSYYLITFVSVTNVVVAAIFIFERVIQVFLWKGVLIGCLCLFYSKDAWLFILTDVASFLSAIDGGL